MNTLNGYSKTTLSDSYVLTANGGHKPISDFATASEVVTALGISGNYVTWTKNGTVNNLTVPYATKSHWLYQDLDLRSENTLPYASYYYGRSISAPFLRYNTADGLNDGGTYHTSIIITPWSDTTGGNAHNIGLTNNGNIWIRSGITEWSNWKKLVFANDAFIKKGSIPVNNENIRDYNLAIEFGAYNTTTSETAINKPFTNYGTLVSFTGNNDTWLLLASLYNDTSLYVRSGNMRDSNGIYNVKIVTDWKKVAFTDSNITGNAASADKLKTAQTIWGQSFDGSGNVDGLFTLTNTGGNGRPFKIGWLDATTENPVLNMWSYDSSLGGFADMCLGISSDVAPQGSLYFNSSTRNWGIGTDSPLYKLHVAGTASTNLLFVGGLSHPMIIGNGSLLSLGAANSSSKASVVLDLNTDSFRRNSASTTISLGTSTYPWVNVHGINYYGSTLIITNTGFGPLEIKRNADNGNPAIKYSNKSETLGYIGISGSDNSNKGLAYRWNSDYSHMYKIFDSGNSSVEGGGNTGGSSITVNLGGTSKTLTIPTSLPANGGVANKLKNLGKHSEVASSTTVPSDLFEGAYYNSGMFMTSNMNDGTTPSSFGNIINVLGNGGSLLLLGWEGSYKTGNIYYRSHRDMVNSGGWTPWRLLAFIDSLVDTANTANKLTTARTINVSIGGTIGTAQSFDGSSNITIPVSGMGEAYLTWGGKDLKGSTSPVDAGMLSELGANRLAFYPNEAIKFERSTDAGNTWFEYIPSSTAGVELCTTSNHSIHNGNTTDSKSVNNYHRVTLTIGGHLYCAMKKLAMFVSTNGATGTTCTLEVGDYASPTVWSTKKTVNVTGWSGWNILLYELTIGKNYEDGQTSVKYIRLTFKLTSISSSNNSSNFLLLKLRLIAPTEWSSNLSTYAITGLPFKVVPSTKEIQFPTSVSATSFKGNATSVTVGSGSSNTYRAIVVHNGNGLYSAGDKVLYNYSTGDVKATSFTGKLNGSLTGGAKGNIIYQSAANTTAFLTNPSTNGYVLKFNTSTGLPYWASDDNTTYSAMSLNEANFGTETISRVITASVLHTKILNQIIASIGYESTRGIEESGNYISGGGQNIVSALFELDEAIKLNDTKVTLTNTTTNANYRVLLSNSANDNNTTEEARKSVYLTFNPQLLTLYTGNVEISGEIHTTTSGTHPKFRMWHDTTNNALYILSGVKDGSSTSGTIHLSGINANRLNSLYLDATTTYIAGATYISGGITASGDITAYSDRRLKSNIKPLENRGYIQPMTYIKDNKECIGFIAQDVLEKYPELVNDNNEYLSLNYLQYVAVLQALIIELEKRIKELENGTRKL